MTVPRRTPSGTARERAQTALAVALALALAASGEASSAAAQSTQTASDAAPATSARSTASRATTARAATGTPDERGRLGVAAAALRRDPLYVDDELSWMLDADQDRSLRRDLRDARVPVLVAVLPSLTEDESGGDTRRVLRTLQQRVGRDAVYVTVDQRGWFDVASVGIPLDLSIPYSLLSPPHDERPYEQQEADPRPPGWTSVPDRMRELLRYVRVAKSGPPNEIVDADRISPLATLPGHHAPANDSEDVVAAGAFGLFFGLLAASGVLAIGRAFRGPLALFRRTSRRTGRRRA
jgi:hypothetical protein